MEKICKLCGLLAELQTSHIIPKFVYKRIEGYMRSSNNPNKRIQDGYKCEMLCKACENQFSVYEKSFQRTVFDPMYTDQMVFHYDENMLKFCVSLLWRVIAYCDIDAELSDATNEIKAQVKDAFNMWQKFLLGQLKHPGKYKQHVIVLDKVSNLLAIQAPASLNTYILSSCDMDICYAGNNIYVYAKIFNIYVISVINIETKNRFKVENIHVTKGLIRRLYNISLPRELIQHIYIRCASAFSSRKLLSEPQQLKITQWVAENKDMLIGSKAYNTFVDDQNAEIANLLNNTGEVE